MGFEFGFGDFYPIGLPVVAFLFLFGLDEAQRGAVVVCRIEPRKGGAGEIFRKFVKLEYFRGF